MLKNYDFIDKQKIRLRLSHESDKGFTLVELLIVLVLFSIIVSLGLFISFDFYKNYNFRSEGSIIVSVLQKARNQSLNNINQARHGVHFSANPLQYILFECPAANPQCTSWVSSSSDLAIAASYGVSITHPTPPFDVVFNQLSGSCVSTLTFDCSTNTSITVGYGTRSYNININTEGRIDW